MTPLPEVELRPIRTVDLEQVGYYLHRRLNRRLSPSSWAAALDPPWTVDAPNHGFMLLADGEVVGVNAAIYSSRVVHGQPRAFCNLAALCVDDATRPHTARLIRAILRQPGYHLTDLSPSGSVVEMDRRLGFAALPTDTLAVPNLPRPARPFRLLHRPGDIAARLTGEQAAIYRDHCEAMAARHLVLVRGEESCYVVFRRDRRRGLPLFATILYASDPPLLAEGFAAVTGHLLRRHGALVTLVERRIARVSAPFARTLDKSRPKMFKSADLEAQDIDDLYSELTCVAW